MWSALPPLGMERAVFALAMSYGVVALLVMPAPGDRAARDEGQAWAHVRLVRTATGVAAVAFIGALVAFPFGLMRGTYFARAAAAYAGDGSEIVATREGPEE